MVVWGQLQEFLVLLVQQLGLVWAAAKLNKKEKLEGLKKLEKLDCLDCLNCLESLPKGILKDEKNIPRLFRLCAIYLHDRQFFG